MAKWPLRGRDVAGNLVLLRVDCCACTLYSVLYVWVYVVNGSLYER